MGVKKRLAIELVPQVWDTPGFWEKFFEGDEDAVSRYEDVLRQMHEPVGASK